jgi:hypothetical protein
MIRVMLVVFAVIPIVVCATQCVGRPDPGCSDARDFVTSPSNNVAHVELNLVHIRRNAERLVGEFDVINSGSIRYEITGVRVGNEFWPKVLLEVSKETKSPWNWCSIAKNDTAKANPEMLGVSPFNEEPMSLRSRLLVDLTPFITQIAQAKYGRIVLPDGNWSMFPLDRLAPPKETLPGDITPQDH